MLQGERVVLRPIERDDLPKLRDLVYTIEVRSLADDAPPLPVSVSELESRFEPEGEEGADSAWFAVEAEGKLIGMCGLHAIEHFHERCDLGIRIGSGYWGKGYGQDAVRTLVGYAFQSLNMRKVCLEVLADDPRATGAYRKAGFVEEGRLLEHAWYDGRYHDTLLMAAFREDWKGG